MENIKYELKLIRPGEIKGCNIGGILAIPNEKLWTDKMLVMLKEEKHGSMIQSVESGKTKEVETFEDSAYRIINEENLNGVIDFLNLNGQIILLPMLPNKNLIQEEGKSNGNFGAEFLSKECFTNIPADSRFYRLDEQISKMIQAITKEYKLDNKINLFGHSTSGLAAMRLSMIKPELIDNLIIGGNADEVPVPIGENGKNLEYPFGIKDFQELFGKDFDEKSFRDISFRFYVGEYEYLDPNLDGIRTENYGIRSDGKAGSGENFAPSQVAKKYKDVFNSKYREDDELSVFERFSNVLADYEKNGLDVKILVYEKDCHGLISPTDLNSAQFDKGTVFSSNASQTIKQCLDEAINIKQFVEKNSDLNVVKDYIKASQKIKYNKQQGDVESRVDALSEVYKEASKQKSEIQEYKDFLQGEDFSPLAIATLTKLREQNDGAIKKSELSILDIASVVVPKANTELKQNMQRIENEQLRESRETEIDQTKE